MLDNKHLKECILISLIVSALISGSLINLPALAQEDSATSSANLPGSSTNPLGAGPDANNLIEKEKSGQVSPEQVKPPLDDCAEGTKPSKKKCVKKQSSTKPQK